MGKIEEPYRYPLRKVLKYTKRKGGDADFEETGEISFDPPSMDSFDESADFKQIIMNAMVSAGRLDKSGNNQEDEKKAEENEEKKKEIPKAGEIKAMLFASRITDVSVRKVKQIFIKLAVRTATLDESGTKLKDSHINKMLLADFEDMLCGYASFFSLPSLLNETEGEAEKVGSE